MSAGFLVRDARPEDLETIVGFNLRLALETERKALNRATLVQGVHAALIEPDRLRYWVVESTESGQVVAQAAITREWSDWRNGWLWWFQSVYVHPDARNRGAFRSLYAHIRSIARESGVVGLRLYVEDGNNLAQKTYRSLGMAPGGYEVYEEIWSAGPINPGRSTSDA